MSQSIPSSLQIWAIALPITILFILGFRKKRGLPLKDLQLKSFLAAVLALYGTISSFKVIHQTIAVQELRTLLGDDNVPVLVVGCFAVIWISAEEIGKLL